jgi:hypothetical protein
MNRAAFVKGRSTFRAVYRRAGRSASPSGLVGAGGEPEAGARPRACRRSARSLRGGEPLDRPAALFFRIGSFQPQGAPDPAGIILGVGRSLDERFPFLGRPYDDRGREAVDLPVSHLGWVSCRPVDARARTRPGGGRDGRGAVHRDRRLGFERGAGVPLPGPPRPRVRRQGVSRSVVTIAPPPVVIPDAQGPGRPRLRRRPLQLKSSRSPSHVRPPRLLGSLASRVVDLGAALRIAPSTWGTRYDHPGGEPGRFRSQVKLIERIHQERRG